MRCPRCGSEVSDEWHYCPECGFDLKHGNDMVRRPFMDMDSIFSMIEKEMKEVDKLFDKELEFFDLTPWFKKGKKGFTIRISHESGKKPEVVVKTFGDVDKSRIEKEVYNRFGIKPEKQGVVEIERKPPKITEEPKTDVKRIGDKLYVDIYLPDVKSEQDIEIKNLENSVEVKALAGEKAYFKILTKPPEAKISGHDFRNGVLHMEFDL